MFTFGFAPLLCLRKIRLVGPLSCQSRFVQDFASSTSKFFLVSVEVVEEYNYLFCLYLVDCFEERTG